VICLIFVPWNLGDAITQLDLDIRRNFYNNLWATILAEMMLLLQDF